MKYLMMTALLSFSAGAFAQEKTITLNDRSEPLVLTRKSMKDMVSKKGELIIQSAVSQETIEQIQLKAKNETRKELQQKYQQQLEQNIARNTEEIAKKTREEIKSDMRQEKLLRSQALEELKKDKELVSQLTEILTADLTPKIQKECEKKAIDAYADSLKSRYPYEDTLDSKHLTQLISAYDFVFIPKKDIFIPIGSYFIEEVEGIHGWNVFTIENKTGNVQQGGKVLKFSKGKAYTHETNHGERLWGGWNGFFSNSSNQAYVLKIYGGNGYMELTLGEIKEMFKKHFTISVKRKKALEL